MKSVTSFIAIVTVVVCLPACSPVEDIDRVDRFLKTYAEHVGVGVWDKEASVSILPYGVKVAENPEFEESLLRLFAQNDQRAPSRFVFFMLIQVVSSIEVDSPLGRAFNKATGGTCPVTQTKGGDKYYSSDLYYWWLDHGKKYEAMPLMEDWLQRDEVKRLVIPVFQQYGPKAEQSK